MSDTDRKPEDLDPKTPDTAADEADGAAAPSEAAADPATPAPAEAATEPEASSDAETIVAEAGPEPVHLEVEPIPDEAASANTPVKAPADSALPVWLGRLPEEMRPYAALARYDRPVGIWLLLIPCWIGLAFTRVPAGLQVIDLLWALLFAVGAIVMRGAGCTWNDITDRKIDAEVERTAGRPLPSGQVTVTQAYGWLAVQLVIGLVVWAALPADAKIVAFLAIPLVAAYPFMKRITWWPQAWLGATLNWGVLVGAATATSVSLAAVLLWVGLALWTIAYDTIYALQDRDDDALIGVKSTARRFGEQATLGAFVFHLAAAAVIALAGWAIGAGQVGAITALVFLAHGLWQAARLKASKEAAALEVFRSNVLAGAIVLVGFLIAAIL